MAKKVVGINCLYSSTVVEAPHKEGSDYAASDNVIFKDEDGKEEYGIVRYVNQDSIDEEKILTSSKILRKATANDLQKVESHVEQSARALASCKDLIEKLNLDMNIFKAGYSFDGNKAHFTFTADERVDFRELVKELAKVLKKQIHLRQIGPRDKAKILGGYGRCGRMLCCNTFLGKLESINMEMVRDQGLESKGSSKLSGACAKLLCCLKYEVEAYREFRKSLPLIGSVIRLKKAISSSKEGFVIAMDILNQKLRIVLSDREEVAVISASDIDKIVKKPESNKS
jgi:cell fate regulator YaaT (PSP1 superfamily)